MKGNRFKTQLVVVFFVIAALMKFSSLNISSQPIKTQKKNKCACTLNCMDWKVQDPVVNRTKKECHVDGVDVITQAGIVKVLAENKNKTLVENFRDELEISVKKHGTKKVSIAAHEDCVGNPVTKDQQLKDLRSAKKTVESWHLGVEVILLWVDSPFEKAEVVE